MDAGDVEPGRLTADVTMVPVPDEVVMERMTWRQIEAAIASGKTTALLNAGAIEQHGPHLPTATDTLIGEAVTERAARVLGNALVAPSVRPALSAHHLGFPGTLAIEFGTFVDILTQMVRGLADAGFRNIALLSSHGGNVDIMLAHTPTIARSVAERADVFMISSLEGYIRQAQEVLDQLEGRVAIVLDGGPTPATKASTIVDCTTDQITVLREGFITRAQLEEALVGLETYS